MSYVIDEVRPFVPHGGHPKRRESAQWTTKPRLLGAKQLLLHVPCMMGRGIAVFLSCGSCQQSADADVTAHRAGAWFVLTVGDLYAADILMLLLWWPNL